MSRDKIIPATKSSLAIHDPFALQTLALSAQEHRKARAHERSERTKAHLASIANFKFQDDNTSSGTEDDNDDNDSEDSEDNNHEDNEGEEDDNYENDNYEDDNHEDDSHGQKGKAPARALQYVTFVS